MGNKESSASSPIGTTDSDNGTKSLSGTIVREHISFTAVVSIRDSQETGNELAKTKVMDALKDPASIIEFGELLKYSFSYESVLKPTRDLLYWSIQSEDTFRNLMHVSRGGIDDWAKSRGKDDLIYPIKQWVLSKESRIYTINPILTWSIREKSISLEPLSKIVIDILPYTKESTVDNLKYWALEGLKSEDVKKIAKDGLVHMLRVSAGGAENETEPTNASASPNGSQNDKK